MEKQNIIALVAMIALLALSGCSLKVTKFEQIIDGNKVDFAQIDKMKKGTACLGLGSRDNSLATAAKKGDMNTVNYVEVENTYIAGIAIKHCTVAYGE